MTRTDEDLRHFYSELPDTSQAERRLQAWIAAGADAPHQHTTARIAPVAAAAAVVAVATTVAVAAPHLHRPHPSAAGTQSSSTRALSTSTATSATQHSAVQPTASRGSAVGSAHHPVQSTTAAAHLTIVTPQVLAQTLLNLLPGTGTTTGLAGRTFNVGQLEPGGPRYHDIDAWFTWNDGHGAASVAVQAWVPYAGDTRRDQPLCARAEGKAGSSCTTLPDGSQLRTHINAVEGHAYLMNQVELQRPDGFDLTISTTNAVNVKQPITRATPPLSKAQLDTIARSPHWQPHVSRAEARRDAHLFTPVHY